MGTALALRYHNHRHTLTTVVNRGCTWWRLCSPAVGHIHPAQRQFHSLTTSFLFWSQSVVWLWSKLQHMKRWVVAHMHIWDHMLCVSLLMLAMRACCSLWGTIVVYNCSNVHKNSALSQLPPHSKNHKMFSTSENRIGVCATLETSKSCKQKTILLHVVFIKRKKPINLES